MHRSISIFINLSIDLCLRYPLYIYLSIVFLSFSLSITTIFPFVSTCLCFSFLYLSIYPRSYPFSNRSISPFFGSTESKANYDGGGWVDEWKPYLGRQVRYQCPFIYLVTVCYLYCVLVRV